MRVRLWLALRLTLLPAQVCLLSTVCTNSDDLFSRKHGEAFRCEFEPFQYHQLASALERFGTTRRPTHARAGCRDYANWRSLSGLTCQDYVTRRYCADGAVIPGQRWALGVAHGWPENNCCECGK